MTINEPIWCAFCNDRPAVGRMVIMKDQSRDQISVVAGVDGCACDLHGRAWTGVPLSSHETTGEVAVFQYVHPDFEQVTENHTIDFAGEKVCTKCGDPTEPMPLWVADRILKAYPSLVLDQGYCWDGICHECAQESECAHCDQKVEDDEDGYQAHPYLH
jgi:hypothetical protein